MKKSDRDPLLYLEDIKLSIERINEYIFGKIFSDFVFDYKTVDAVVRNFEIIGEASNKLPDYIKDKYPQVPWEEMYRLRNKISHDYFGIDHNIIWSIITDQLPENYLDIVELLKKEQL